jgi:hypothetical protein
MPPSPARNAVTSAEAFSNDLSIRFASTFNSPILDRCVQLRHVAVYGRVPSPQERAVRLPRSRQQPMPEDVRFQLTSCNRSLVDSSPSRRLRLEPRATVAFFRLATFLPISPAPFASRLAFRALLVLRLATLARLTLRLVLRLMVFPSSPVTWLAFFPAPPTIAAKSADNSLSKNAICCRLRDIKITSGRRPSIKSGVEIGPPGAQLLKRLCTGGGHLFRVKTRCVCRSSGRT